MKETFREYETRVLATQLCSTVDLEEEEEGVNPTMLTHTCTHRPSVGFSFVSFRIENLPTPRL